MDDTLTKLMRVVTEELSWVHGVMPASGLGAGTRFAEDLQLDSLDFVELLMAVEDAFLVEVDDGEASEKTTVGELAAYVDLLLDAERKRIGEA